MTISEDKKTITLEVPLGGTVYGFLTSCNDACYFQKEEFKRKFPEATCNLSSPCHVYPHSVRPITVNLTGLAYIITHWQEDVFATEKEAEEAMYKLCEEHKRILLDAGIQVTERK